MTENSILICKTCLITNVKMFQSDTLNNAYSELIGFQCDDTTTEYVCYQCAALLLKFQQFRTKCLRAYQVISELVRFSDNSKLTEDVVHMIDRKLCNLESTIIKIEIKENIFNFFYNESNNKCESKEPEQSTKIEIDDVIAASEIKAKVELYDDKDQAASDEYESLHLRDDIGLDEKPTIFLVSSDTEDESTKMNIKNEPVNKKLEQGNTDNSSTETINKSKSFMDDITLVSLTPEEIKNEILLRKESYNYKNNKYKCDLCYRAFGVLRTYENHMKKHDKEIGEYDCDYCHFRYSKKRLIRHHIIRCHAMKFCCKLCPYTCANASQAKAHVGQHKGKTYQCEECEQIFSFQHTLIMHQRTKHSTEFVCGMCGSTFAKERGLNLHISYIHKMDTNEQKGPLCEECDVHFATETAWKRHLVLSSKHTVSYGCEVCGETHESKEALRMHVKVHARNKGWRAANEASITLKKHIDCTLCEQSFFGRKMYMEHMNKHHPEDSDVVEKPLPTLKYVCEICGKMFKHQVLVTYHKKSVHIGEKPFSCSVCGKTYKKPNNLKIHSLTHSSTRFQCHLCGKSFLYSTSLDRHIKEHLGIRLYKCNICEKSFAHPCEVKNHNRYVHEKVPWPKRDRRKKIKSASEFSPTTL